VRSNRKAYITTPVATKESSLASIKRFHGCIPQDQIDMIQRFYDETGLGEDGRIHLNTLLLIAWGGKKDLEEVLFTFRRHNTTWTGQPAEYRGSIDDVPAGFAFLEENRKVFRTVYEELGIPVPWEYKLHAS
jgi:hypothetical protein